MKVQYYQKYNYIPSKDKNEKQNPMKEEQIEYLNKNIENCYIAHCDSKKNITSGGGPGARPIGIFIKK